MSVDKSCHICMSYLRPLKEWSNWLACDCGVRKYYKMDDSSITLSDLLSSSGKYPERLQSPELTDALKDNGVKLLNRVNQLLDELKVGPVSVSSGFRTSGANAAIPNAAKKSHHMTCNAVDIHDPDGKLDELFSSNIDVLEKYGLFLESPDSTIGWSHLQDIPTHNNPFIP